MKTPKVLNLFIAGCVIISILLNGLLVRFTLGQQDCDFLKKAFKNQSSVLELFTLASIPLTILYTMFNENKNASMTDTASKPAGKEANNKKNTSSDYSITNELTSQSVRSKLERLWNPLYNAYSSLTFGSSKDCTVGFVNKCTAPPIGVFVMLILSLFVLLPRGAIDYSSMNININRRGNTQLNS